MKRLLPCIVAVFGTMASAVLAAMLVHSPVPIFAAVFALLLGALLMFLGGMMTLGSAVLIHLLTLPTEFDASFGRALPLMEKLDVLYEIDQPHARTLLRAAAMTYVAASMMSLLNIARWWAILRR